MNSVNWWLMAVSFVLGLALTAAVMIRRVKREVPVYDSRGGGAAAATLTGGGGAAAETKSVAAEPEAEAPTTTIRRPDLDAPTSKLAAGAAGGAAAAGLIGGKGDDDAATTVIRTPETDVDAPTTAMRTPELDTPTTAFTVPDTSAPVEDAVEDAPDDGGGVSTGALAAGAAGGAVATGLLGSAKGGADTDSDTEASAPYGAGSVRLAAGAEPPSGWDIKGNEDSMLYHTVDSPSYRQTIAELWFRDEDTARNAGFRHWKEGRASGAAASFVDAEPELPPGPHGPGSAVPNDDGSGPEGWTVKGNEDSMLYHSLESPHYSRTIAEVWFRDVETAEAARFNRWDSGKSQRGKN